MKRKQQMKRINKQWWRENSDFYYEVAKGEYEGPYPTMERKGEDSTVIDSGEILAVLANKKVDNEE